eukprot:COSAG01_NODE_4286_length_5174_cov_3.830542_8_plen_44_part_00
MAVALMTGGVAASLLPREATTRSMIERQRVGGAVPPTGAGGVR